MLLRLFCQCSIQNFGVSHFVGIVAMLSQDFASSGINNCERTSLSFVRILSSVQRQLGQYFCKQDTNLHRHQPQRACPATFEQEDHQ